jgi:hypothetical protein
MNAEAIGLIRDEVWKLMDLLSTTHNTTTKQFISIIIQNVMEIGIISDEKPQYLLIANLLVLGMTKDEVIELVDDVYGANDNRIKGMN